MAKRHAEVWCRDNGKQVPWPPKRDLARRYLNRLKREEASEDIGKLSNILWDLMHEDAWNYRESVQIKALYRVIVVLIGNLGPQCEMLAQSHTEAKASASGCRSMHDPVNALE